MDAWPKPGVAGGCRAACVTTNPKDSSRVVFDSEELQYVILTQYPRGVFRAHQFMEIIHECSSTEFTSWWKSTDMVAYRRKNARTRR